jgi:hypothetical protein
MATTPVTSDGPGGDVRWLLVNIAGSESSASSVDAWRRLRALGAHYLQPAVCLVPERDDTTSAVAHIVARVERGGGRARVFPLGVLDAASERDVVAAFSAERADEYDQVVDRSREFTGEIAMEREHRRVSYTEVEESRVDLRRLQRWLASIRKRDYFDAPGFARAAAAVEACERLLAEFEAEAYQAEVHPTAEDLARVPWRLRLRMLGSPAGCWMIAALVPLAA